jgi:aminoglycoside phosphotransferase (APT) family kinase protein
MMLDIEPLVRDLAPGLLARKGASVACIATTRRKYLVFDAGDAGRPACVVEYGDRERLTRTAQVLTLLSGKLPGVVPAVLCCTPTDGGDYVLIQQGLEGVPWFRVADTVTSKDGWRALLRRSLDTMTMLHEAIRTEYAWSSAIDIGDEIQRQAATALRTGVPLTTDTLRLVQEWRRMPHQSMPCHCQHGDFSLNNLLVGDASMAIIDFDEFGSTTAPLHDAFGLALSFSLTQDAPPLPRVELIGECVRRGTAGEMIDPRLVPGLLLHHLLLRINQCHGAHRRARLRRMLIEWADELARAPQAFLA